MGVFMEGAATVNFQYYCSLNTRAIEVNGIETHASFHFEMFCAKLSVSTKGKQHLGDFLHFECFPVQMQVPSSDSDGYLRLNPYIEASVSMPWKV